MVKVRGCLHAEGSLPLWNRQLEVLHNFGCDGINGVVNADVCTFILGWKQNGKTQIIVVTILEEIDVALYGVVKP